MLQADLTMCQKDALDLRESLGLGGLPTTIPDQIAPHSRFHPSRPDCGRRAVYALGVPPIGRFRTLLCLKRRSSPALDIDADKKNQTDNEVDADGKDAEAMIALEYPSDGAVGEGAED